MIENINSTVEERGMITHILGHRIWVTGQRQPYDAPGEVTSD